MCFLKSIMEAVRFNCSKKTIFSSFFRHLHQNSQVYENKGTKKAWFSLTFVGIIENFSIKENSPYLSFLGDLKVGCLWLDILLILYKYGGKSFIWPPKDKEEVQKNGKEGITRNF